MGTPTDPVPDVPGSGRSNNREQRGHQVDFGGPETDDRICPDGLGEDVPEAARHQALLSWSSDRQPSARRGSAYGHAWRSEAASWSKREAQRLYEYRSLSRRSGAGPRTGVSSSTDLATCRW
jgi:hypothetical protein